MARCSYLRGILHLTGCTDVPSIAGALACFVIALPLPEQSFAGPVAPNLFTPSEPKPPRGSALLGEVEDTKHAQSLGAVSPGPHIHNCKGQGGAHEMHGRQHWAKHRNYGCRHEEEPHVVSSSSSE